MLVLAARLLLVVRDGAPLWCCVRKVRARAVPHCFPGSTMPSHRFLIKNRGDDIPDNGDRSAEDLARDDPVSRSRKRKFCAVCRAWKYCGRHAEPCVAPGMVPPSSSDTESVPPETRAFSVQPASEPVVRLGSPAAASAAATDSSEQNDAVATLASLRERRSASEAQFVSVAGEPVGALDCEPIPESEVRPLLSDGANVSILTPGSGSVGTLPTGANALAEHGAAGTSPADPPPSKRVRLSGPAQRNAHDKMLLEKLEIKLQHTFQAVFNGHPAPAVAAVIWACPSACGLDVFNRAPMYMAYQPPGSSQGTADLGARVRGALPQAASFLANAIWPDCRVVAPVQVDLVSTAVRGERAAAPRQVLLPGAVPDPWQLLRACATVMSAGGVRAACDLYSSVLYACVQEGGMLGVGKVPSRAVMVQHLCRAGVVDRDAVADSSDLYCSVDTRPSALPSGVKNHRCPAVVAYLMAIAVACAYRDNVVADFLSAKLKARIRRFQTRKDRLRDGLELLEGGDELRRRMNQFNAKAADCNAALALESLWTVLVKQVEAARRPDELPGHAGHVHEPDPRRFFDSFLGGELLTEEMPDVVHALR